MTTVFLATVRTADEAAKLACEKATECLQGVHGNVGYDDPMLVGKYFGSEVLPLEVGGPAQFTRRSRLLAP